MVGVKRKAETTTSTRSYKSFRAQPQLAPSAGGRWTSIRAGNSIASAPWTRARKFKRAGVKKRPYRAKSARGHKGFNPTWNRNIAFPHSISPYVQVHSQSGSNFNVPTSGNNKAYLLVFYTNTAQRGLFIKEDGMVTDVVMATINTATLVASGPLGLALNLRNVTKADDVAGVVKCLVAPTPLTYDVSSTNLNYASGNFRQHLDSIMTNNPCVKTYTAHHFRETKTISSFPADVSRSTQYDPFVFTAARDGAGASSTLNKGVSDGLLNMPMAAVIMQFPTVASQNTYEYTVHSADRLRFAEGTVMASQHRLPRAVDPEAHAVAVRQAASSAGAANPAYG